jgi:ATP-dependent Clp protease ATP-binding subunit ClpC
LEDPIAEEILKGELTEGDSLEVDYDKEKEEIRILNKVKSVKKKKEEKKEE